MRGKSCLERRSPELFGKGSRFNHRFVTCLDDRRLNEHLPQESNEPLRYRFATENPASRAIGASAEMPRKRTGQQQ